MQKKGIEDVTSVDFDNQIIQLYPKYDDEGNRFIKAQNITTARALCSTLDDMDLKSTIINQHINLYTEDARSQVLLAKVFKYKGIQISDYVDIIDIDLGWTNYCQLINKKIPEFTNNLIVLDKDVEFKSKNEEQKAAIESDNVLFMPVDVEKGMFTFLKNHTVFNKFEEILRKNNCIMSYDVCFNQWPEAEYDGSIEYKNWFEYLEKDIPSIDLLYDFWCTQNIEIVDKFISSFRVAYNIIADREDLDYFL